MTDGASFIDLPDGRGKIYVPRKRSGTLAKHPCPDCFACQMCSDDRCDLCRQEKKSAAGKTPQKKR